MKTSRQRWHLHWHPIVSGALLLLVTLAQPSQAAEFSCATGDVACLIDAINTANANGEVNTIFLEAGFYTLLSPFGHTPLDPSDPAFHTAVGLPEITSTLTIQGASGISTVIERDPSLGFGQPWFRVLTVAASGNLTLADLTLQGGVGPFGAGGGGVLNNGILAVVNSVIRRNDGGPFGNCGGISSIATLTIVGSTVTENTGEVAGGLCGGTATLILESSIISNGADFGGGGIVAAFVPMGLPGHPVGSLVVQNSTIARNTAELGSGAGVSVFNGTATFINSTIADNVNGSRDSPIGPVPGAGITVGTGTGPIVIVNTILARNKAIDSGGTSVAADCEGDLTSFGNNLIGDPSGCTVTLLSSDLTGDPGLGRFKDNGRPGNGHFPLNPSSQAIDAGNDAVCPRVDQLERLRIGQCDIGAIRFGKEGK
jgi:hypothetical protein